jgi:PAS domain S-box-containing protein
LPRRLTSSTLHLHKEPRVSKPLDVYNRPILDGVNHVMMEEDQRVDDNTFRLHQLVEGGQKQAPEGLAAEAHFLRAMTEITEVAWSNLQPEVLGARLLEAIARAQGFAYGALWQLTSRRLEAVIVSAVGENTSAYLGFRLKLNDPLAVVARAIRTAQPAFCNQVQDTPLAAYPLLQIIRPRALLALPLIHRKGNVVGALSFGDAVNPERFTERDLIQGMILARQAAQAIENSDLWTQLQHLEECYRVVTESINDALYVLDVNGRVTFANAALERLTGYPLEELLGRPATLFCAFGSNARRKRAFQSLLAGSHVEIEIKRKDGRRLPADLYGMHLLQQGRNADRLGVLHDITERKRAAEEVDRRQREAEVMAELARTLNAFLDPGTIIQRVVEGARVLCHSDGAMIALRDPTSEAMVMRYAVGSSCGELKDCRIEPGQGVGGQVLLSGRPFRTDDYANDPRLSHGDINLAKAHGVVSLIAVPIRIGARIEGLLYIDNHLPRLFTDHDEAMLIQLAEHAAIAIHNARLYEESERRRRIAENLAGIERLLSASLDPQEVGQRIVESVGGLFGTVSASLLQLDPVSDSFAVVASSGEMNAPLGTSMRLIRKSRLIALAIRKRQPVATANFAIKAHAGRRTESAAKPQGTGHRTLLAVPLIRQDRVIGVLTVIDHPGRIFSQEEISLAQTFAHQAASAIALSELRRREAGLTAAAERNRIARDLHDGLAQELAYIYREARRVASGRADADTARHLEVAAGRALDESRDAIALLSAPTEQPLDAVIASAAEDVGRRESIVERLDLAEDLTVPHAVRNALARIVREAITNAARHSEAREVEVSLRADEGILLAVRDDGGGFDTSRPNGGFGITSMRERAEAVGGAFSIRSVPGRGTEVEVRIR